MQDASRNASLLDQHRHKRMEELRRDKGGDRDERGVRDERSERRDEPTETRSERDERRERHERHRTERREREHRSREHGGREHDREHRSRERSNRHRSDRSDRHHHHHRHARSDTRSQSPPRKTRAQREAEDLERATTPYFDKDKVLGAGSRLMDERARARTVADAAELTSRFASGTKGAFL